MQWSGIILHSMKALTISDAENMIIALQMRFGASALRATIR